MRTQPQEPDFSPRRIGRYLLHRQIAAGGMATVHLGRLLGQVGFSRTVAIKRMHQHCAQDPDFVSMFIDEARLAARIRHPNVVPTLDVVALEGDLFLVMEYVQGETLSRLWHHAVKSGTPIAPRVAAGVLAGVLEGLHAAHEAVGEHGEALGIVHRDVSPQNIIVGNDGIARVLDFGIAKATNRIQTTRDGQIKGKVEYMAPEQVRGSLVDRRTDVYAVSVILWEMLTGTRLFTADNPVALWGKVLHGTTTPPSAIEPSIPKAIDEVTMRGLEPDPTKRFQTGEDMAIALERAVHIASPREIGRWVQELAGKKLRQREDMIAELDSQSAEYTLPVELTSSVSESNHSAPGPGAAKVDTGSHAGAARTSPTTAADRDLESARAALVPRAAIPSRPESAPIPPRPSSPSLTRRPSPPAPKVRSTPATAAVSATSAPSSARPPGSAQPSPPRPSPVVSAAPSPPSPVVSAAPSPPRPSPVVSAAPSPPSPVVSAAPSPPSPVVSAAPSPPSPPAPSPVPENAAPAIAISEPVAPPPTAAPSPEAVAFSVIESTAPVQAPAPASAAGLAVAPVIGPTPSMTEPAATPLWVAPPGVGPSPSFADLAPRIRASAPSISGAPAMAPPQPGFAASEADDQAFVAVPAYRRRVPLVVAGVAGAALTLGLIGFALSKRAGTPSPTASVSAVVSVATAPSSIPAASTAEPTPPPLPAKITLRIDVAPSSATVEVDGEVVRDGSVSLARSSQPVRLVTKALGYKTDDRTFTPTEDGSVSISLERAVGAPPRPTGTVKIRGPMESEL